MTPHDRALELLKLAKRDENAAHVLQADSSIDDGTIGFHYQQAAEKLLKAILSPASDGLWPALSWHAQKPRQMA